MKTRVIIPGVLLAIALTLTALAACADDDDDDDDEASTPTPTTTEAPSSPSGSPTASASVEPTASPTGSPGVETYEDPRFGYAVTLPPKWHQATAFGDAFAETGGRPQAGGNAEDYTVLTDISLEDEMQFVETAQTRPDLLTGLGNWLDFFLLNSVAIFPTTFDESALTASADQGNVKYLVSEVDELTLDNGQVVTRYKVELLSDYGHFQYDSVYVRTTVEDCSDCTGFIIRTAIAGTSFLNPGGDLVPASYPIEEFETISRSLKPNGSRAALNSDLTTNQVSARFVQDWLADCGERATSLLRRGRWDKSGLSLGTGNWRLHRNRRAAQNGRPSCSLLRSAQT